MKTVTKTYRICTAEELKGLDPVRYQNEFNRWIEFQDQYGWWRDTLRNVADEPQYYIPEYRDAQESDKAKVAERWAEVVGFVSYGVAREFDVDSGTIKLQGFELCIHDFLKLINYEHPEPFVLDAILRQFPRGRRIVDIGEELGSHFYMGSMDIAADFLWEVFGTPATTEDGDPTDDSLLLEAGIDTCMQQIEGLIRDFIKDMGQAILAALREDLEWRTSEELFLESDLEFEVLDEVHTV